MSRVARNGQALVPLLCSNGTFIGRRRSTGPSHRAPALPYASYVYNAMEQLASRNTSAPGGPIGTVHYIYDTQGHLIAEADAATGATMREYLWLPSNDNQNNTLAEDMMAANDNAPVDLPLAVVNVSATPVVYQVHTDHLGRPIRMTDAAKATIWQATWKPWGEVQSITGAVANNLRFPGQYFQLETGLAYNWHRTYDPVTGRYTQPDPLRFVDGPSIYAYAGSSPFMFVDPFGRVYRPPGVFGHGDLTVTGGSHGGLVVDTPTSEGIYIPPGGAIPSGADVDFFCLKGVWYKIKDANRTAGGSAGRGDVGVNFNTGQIDRRRGVSGHVLGAAPTPGNIVYPADDQPFIWDIVDWFKGGESPTEYVGRIAGICGCK
jgi:RHS repeat-associated protein